MDNIFNVNPLMKTNWYVITGGPSSGKTTVIDMLASRGYKTTIENARHYIDSQRHAGRTVGDIRNQQKEFQSSIVEMQIKLEKEIPPNEIVFLDRAIPDAVAYYRLMNHEIDVRLAEAMKNVSYRKIFILGYLPMVNDYARTEDVNAQKKIHSLITEVYESLPFPVIHIPVLAAETRVEMILKNL